MSGRLLVASHNLHKIAEIKALAAHLKLQIVGLPEVDQYPEVLEDGDTFKANAQKKAVEIANLSGEIVLADDSGLAVDALNGAPGVHSARFAGEPTSDERNNQLLLQKMKDYPLDQRGAEFRCVMALALPDGRLEFSEGICRGVILFEPRGDGGFGYDPLFFIPELDLTFAELEPELKNRISHRSLAMKEMLQIINNLKL